MKFKKQIPDLIKLENLIGYSFNDKDILTQSLTHPSSENSKFSNMERLEFLGDRVLGLIIAEKIFIKFNSRKEGELSSYFNYLVQRSTCVIIARKINLDNFIIFGKSEFSSDGLKDSILSNILESLIGAIFIDSGYDNAKIVVSTLWDDLINDEKIDLNISNPKSELQETVLSSKKDLPVYKLLSVSGKDHKPEFTIMLSVVGYESVLAIGNSKQEAEKNAAMEMLKCMK
ncbi:ribonuclease III [Hyphomicrobiales bacterium]|jgi:ribonuclease-3|nr:ribonuclease III [Hyphomicrobiales bacterium]MDA9034952.1 ribonuclease III [Hyphomicrobiales bacterium]MDA9905195.1 ribonuclease III [Hyphomicrobiales bacterium]|tara:strand:- start:1787 stop:2476 length:690 start_codon:yes stop_codon:yes gene_type:complete